MNRTQVGLIGLLAAGVATIVSLVVAATAAAGSFSVRACLTGSAGGPPGQPAPPPLDVPVIGWSGLVVLLCVAGFTGGGLWGQQRVKGHRGAGGRRLRAAPSTTLQVLLVTLFLFGGIALAYETHAVAGVGANPDLWPITYYVRCAYDVAALPSLAGAVLVATLVGHWLGCERAVELSD